MSVITRQLRYNHDHILEYICILIRVYTIQLEEPSEHFASCPGCKSPKEPLRKINNRKDLDEYLRHMKWTKHERFKGQFTCLSCKKVFSHRSDLDRHPCSYKVDGDDFARYTLIEEGSVTYNVLQKMSPAALYQQCFEEKKCLPNLYPCKIQNAINLPYFPLLTSSSI